MRKKEDFENLLCAIEFTKDEKKLSFFKNFLRYKECPKLPNDKVNMFAYLVFLEYALVAWRKHVKQFGCLAMKFEDFVEFKWPAYDFEEESDDEVCEDEE